MAERKTAKEYLSEIRELRDKIRDLELRAELLFEKAKGVRAMRLKKDRVQTSIVNKFEDIEAERWEVLAKIEKERNICEKKKQVREDQIARMDKQIHREILTEMYIKDKDGRNPSLGDVAKKVHLEYTYVSRLHSEALQEFEKKFM